MNFFLNKSIYYRKDKLIDYLEGKGIKSESGELTIVTNVYFLIKSLSSKVTHTNDLNINLKRIIDFLKMLHTRLKVFAFKLIILCANGKETNLCSIILSLQDTATKAFKERKMFFEEMFNLERYLLNYVSLTKNSLSLNSKATVLLSHGKHWKLV
ncbi:MAG: hypothetical protein HQK84_11495 [Nitrospinae bacterium]|nr:hypothetical protein [Nitrospinota bacterium]